MGHRTHACHATLLAGLASRAFVRTLVTWPNVRTSCNPHALAASRAIATWDVARICHHQKGDTTLAQVRLLGIRTGALVATRFSSAVFRALLLPEERTSASAQVTSSTKSRHLKPHFSPLQFLAHAGPRTTEVSDKKPRLHTAGRTPWLYTKAHRYSSPPELEIEAI